MIFPGSAVLPCYVYCSPRICNRNRYPSADLAIIGLVSDDPLEYRLDLGATNWAVLHGEQIAQLSISPQITTNN